MILHNNNHNNIKLKITEFLYFPTMPPILINLTNPQSVITPMVPNERPYIYKVDILSPEASMSSKSQHNTTQSNYTSIHITLILFFISIFIIIHNVIQLNTPQSYTNLFPYNNLHLTLLYQWYILELSYLLSPLLLLLLLLLFTNILLLWIFHILYHWIRYNLQLQSEVIIMISKHFIYNPVFKYWLIIITTPLMISLNNEWTKYAFTIQNFLNFTNNSITNNISLNSYVKQIIQIAIITIINPSYFYFNPPYYTYKFYVLCFPFKLYF